MSSQLCGGTVSLRVCRCDTRPAEPTIVFMVRIYEEVGCVAKYRGMTLEYDGTIMLMVLRQVPRFLSAIGAPEADFFAAIGHKMCRLNRTDAS